MCCVRAARAWNDLLQYGRISIELCLNMTDQPMAKLQPGAGHHRCYWSIPTSESNDVFAATTIAYLLASNSSFRVSSHTRVVLRPIMRADP